MAQDKLTFRKYTTIRKETKGNPSGFTTRQGRSTQAGSMKALLSCRQNHNLLFPQAKVEKSYCTEWMNKVAYISSSYRKEWSSNVLCMYGWWLLRTKTKKSCCCCTIFTWMMSILLQRKTSLCELDVTLFRYQYGRGIIYYVKSMDNFFCRHLCK